MTNRILLALAIAMLAAHTHAASRAYIDPPPPFYADDRVRITIETDFPYPPEDQFNVRGDGLSLQRLGSGNGRYMWEATFYSDSGSGTIEITGPGLVDGGTRVPFTILPPLIKEWSDPVEHVRQLVAARRIPAIVVAEASTLRPYVGQAVTITWWQYAPMELDVTFGHNDERMAKYPEVHIGDKLDKEMAPLAGMMMSRRRAAARMITAQEPGRIVIPPMQFQGMPRSPGPYEYGVRPATFGQFLRISNAIELDVQPMPAAAKGLPIGPFTVACSDTRGWGVSRHWPSQLISVRGGNPETVQSFAFEGAPKYGIVLHPPSISNTTQRIWLMYAHERQLMEMPRPILRYFDPISGSVQTATCESTPAPRTEDAEPADASSLIRTPKERRAVQIEEARANPRKGALDPAMMEVALESGRAISFVLAAIGLIGLLAAFRA